MLWLGCIRWVGAQQAAQDGRPFSGRSLTALDASRSAEDPSYIQKLEMRNFMERLAACSAQYTAGEKDAALEGIRKLQKEAVGPERRYRVYAQLARLYYQDRQFEQAALNFEQALQVKPGDAIMICNLSAAYMNMNEVEKAKQVLQRIDRKLITENRLRAAVEFNLACINSLQLKTSDALEHLSLAAESDPVFTATHIGDPQLDAIRFEKRYVLIQRKLDRQFQPVE